MTWQDKTFNDLWNMADNNSKKDNQLSIVQIQQVLVLQEAALTLMLEKLVRLEETCRYLMEAHYLKNSSDQQDSGH
jgi:hypothetical protein